MALGLNTESGGDYKPIIKFNAKAGRVYRVDRSQDSSGNWVTNEVEITDIFQFVPDFENVEVGWISFASGQAPDFRMVKVGGDKGVAPTDNHKDGFRLNLKLSKACGGDIREMAGTAKSLKGSIERLHDQYIAGLVENPGKLPVVAMKGCTTIVTQSREGKTSSFAPIFEITSWVARPAEFDAPQEQQAAAPPPATKPATPPPAATPAPAPAMADGEEF